MTFKYQQHEEAALRAVSDGCSMSWEIREKTELTDGQCSRALTKLANAGKINRTRHGVYTWPEGVPRIGEKRPSILDWLKRPFK